MLKFEIEICIKKWEMITKRDEFFVTFFLIILGDPFLFF